MALEHRMDDIDILNEEPVVFRARSGKAEVTIRELSISEFYRFVPGLQALIARFAGLFVKFRVDLKDLDRLTTRHAAEEMSGRLQVLFSFAEFRREFFDLLRKVCVVHMPRRRFEKEFTVSQMASIFVFLYLFNVDGVKKKLTLALSEVGIRSARISETLSSRSTGSGSFRKTLARRFRPLTPLPASSS
jgi:hypothetical protein